MQRPWDFKLLPCARVALAILGMAAALPAQVPDYFPLQEGNEWVYRVSGAFRAGTREPFVVMRVARIEERGGLQYALLEGEPRGPVWLRQDGQGNVWAHDPAGDRLWYAFGKPEREVYQTQLPYCCGRAVIESKKARWDGPAGRSDFGLEMRYPGVFQLGLDKEIFLPYIGLVERWENIGGPLVARMDLVHARIGGVTVISQPEVTFGLSIDRQVYPPGGKLRARMTLRNTGEPLELEFSSGQIYDLAIRDSAGKVVGQWSAGRSFILVLQRLRIEGGERNWVEEAPLSANGNPLPPGEYTAEAWLVTTGGIRYRASAGFAIQR
jgi:hypothetical protein